MGLRSLWVCLLLVVSSCFQVKIASGTFTCREPDDRCPDGQLCSAGVCVNPGDERADLGTAPADLSGGEEDLSGADLSGADLRAPADLTGVDMGPDPCAAGWTEVGGGRIFACRRAFTVTGGSYAGLCRSGYHVCSSSDDLEPLSNIRCYGAGGFYTTAIDIAVRNVNNGGVRSADPVCAPQAADTDRALLGCGNADNLYVLSNSGCNDVSRAMRCGAAPSGWTCTSAKQVSHTAGPGGVLCCQ